MTSGPLRAQEGAHEGAQEGMPISLGVRVGGNMGDNTEDLSPISKSQATGPVLGGYSEFGLSKGLFLSGEFLYLGSGSRLSYLGSNASFNLDEFVIPISLKYKVLAASRPTDPHAYVFTGMSIGWVTTSEVVSPLATTDLKDQTESMDYGFHFGLGLDAPLSESKAFTVDIRYSLGLRDLDKSSTAELKTRNLSLIVGLNFKVK
jgi:hypothetical protein